MEEKRDGFPGQERMVGRMTQTTIAGMVGPGSIRHNNRKFIAENVDPSRTWQNIIFCNDDLKQVYHELFDEAVKEYNASKKKTRDKIPDYYEHIRQGKQEKLFHETIFQIGNLESCGCGTPEAERATAALKEFASSFQERNPYLRVFNMVLHLDEATPHLHVDFVPVAVNQKRGVSTRVSMKQALKQEGFVGVSKKQSEWAAWMEREKEALKEIAQQHDFEIISLGGGRPHMDLPDYYVAARRLEEIQALVAEAEQELSQRQDEVEKMREEAARILQEAREDAQGYKNMLQPVRAEYEAKKAYLEGMDKDFDLTQVKENRSLSGKVKSYTVPAAVWETQQITRMDASAEQVAQEKWKMHMEGFNDLPVVARNRKLREELQCKEKELLEKEMKNRKMETEITYLKRELDYLIRNLPPEVLETIQQEEKTQKRWHSMSMER